MTATGIIGSISMLVVAGVIINDIIKNKVDMTIQK